MTSEGNLLRFIRFGEVSSLMVHFLNLNLPPLGKLAEKFLLCYSNSKGVMIDVMDEVRIIYMVLFLHRVSPFFSPNLATYFL